MQTFYKVKGLDGKISTIIATEKSLGMPLPAVKFYTADDGDHLPNPKLGG